MPNHYSTLGISFYPAGKLYCMQTCTCRHTQATTIPLYFVILFVSHCLWLHNSKKYCRGDHKMIMIRENFAKYRLMDLKFISYDTFQHSSVQRVLRSSLLLYRWFALIQNICHAGELSSITVQSLIKITAVFGTYLKICWGASWHRKLTEKTNPKQSRINASFYNLLLIPLFTYWSWYNGWMPK